VSNSVTVTIQVNGELLTRTVEPRLNLADFLRSEGLTGTNIGCEHGVCGACTVRIDNNTARSCLILAVQCEGSIVETIEGVTDQASLKDLQDAFISNNALQCGFCTPGMLMSADELLRDNSLPTRDEIREHLSGNYCRCTGYQAIVDAVEQVAKQRVGAF
jgi:carbon-monoxide dehydrogenase small subunit